MKIIKTAKYVKIAQEQSINDWITSIFDSIPSGDEIDLSLVYGIPEQMKQKIINILGEEIFEIANIIAGNQEITWENGQVGDSFAFIIRAFYDYFQSNDIASNAMAKTIYKNYHDPGDVDWEIPSIQNFYNMSPFYLQNAIKQYYPNIKETDDDNDGDDYDRNSPEYEPPSWDSGVTPEVQEREYAYASYYSLIKTSQYQQKKFFNGFGYDRWSNYLQKGATLFESGKIKADQLTNIVRYIPDEILQGIIEERYNWAMDRDGGNWKILDAGIAELKNRNLKAQKYTRPDRQGYDEESMKWKREQTLKREQSAMDYTEKQRIKRQQEESQQTDQGII